ncbi:MAG: hypothetical protein ACRDD1_15020, partial [Planctomycetia bacterium]
PVLDTSARVNLRPIISVRGIEVDSLVGEEQITASGARAGGIRRGVALTQLRAVGGRFEFRLNGRGAWRRIDASRINANRSLLLGPNDRLRFRATPGAGAGRVQMQYRAWSAETRSGRMVSTRTSGGESPYSASRRNLTLRTRPSRSADVGLAAALEATNKPKVGFNSAEVSSINEAAVDRLFSTDLELDLLGDME